MRKKLFTFLLALAASIVPLFAESGTCGENLTWSYDTNTGVLNISGEGKMNDFYQAPWYKYRYSITEVNLSDGITTIGASAFYECTQLSSITIPDNVTEIGETAFYYCYGLKELTIGSAVNIIHRMSFFNCHNIENVYIHDLAAWCNITFVPDSWYGMVSNPLQYANHLYLNNVEITDLTIPTGVSSISDYAFYFCTCFTSVNLPSSISSIGSHAFDGCQLLTSVKIPSNVVNIASYAFDNCNNLVAVDWYAKNCNSYYFGNNIRTFTFGNEVESIPPSLCSNMNITSVKIPNSVINIGDEAFKGCHIKTIVIPESVENIGDSAFYSNSLDTVTLCSNAIVSKLYSNSNNLRTIFGNQVKKYILDEGVISIGDYAFYGYYQNLTIKLPCSINKIGVNSIPSSCIITKNCGVTNTSEAYITLCEGEELIWGNENITHVETTSAGDYTYNTKTVLYDDSIATLHLTVNPTRNITLPDTTLCYEEDLYIDGVLFDLEKVPNTKQTWKRTLKSVDGCDSIVKIDVTWKQVPSDVILTIKDEYDSFYTGSITISKVIGKYDSYTLNGVEFASLKNLTAGKYRLAFFNYNCTDSLIKEVTIQRYGMRYGDLGYLLNDETHTATVTYRGTYYGTYGYSANMTIPKTVTFNNIEYLVTAIGKDAFTGKQVKSLKLESETPLTLHEQAGIVGSCLIYVPYGSLSAYSADVIWKKQSLHVINPLHTSATIGTTSATITLGVGDEVAHIASCGIAEGESTVGNVLEYIGLEPNSTYSDIPLFVKTIEGDSDVLTVTFSTTALELTTKPSKAVSSNTAILLAETNMSDAEVNCGFEWKRNDAPADMAGTKVFCPVVDGQMAGRLKNLKDDVYYKYRAFYQSAAGNMYYGDWQYIFTGDNTVEFDPILYTYGATVVKENEATISGYALAGSEDFTEQGFEYWAESRVQGQSNQVPSTDGAPRRMPTALNEHFFVQASGISLRATLTNLDAGTVYKYRVYGKAGDQYYYGSEQTFTTQGEYKGDDTEAIEDVQIDNTQSTKAQKILHNGQIYILRGEKVYSVTGQEVK